MGEGYWCFLGGAGEDRGVDVRSHSLQARRSCGVRRRGGRALRVGGGGERVGGGGWGRAVEQGSRLEGVMGEVCADFGWGNDGLVELEVGSDGCLWRLGGAGV